MVVCGLLIGNRGRALAMSEHTCERLDSFWELVDEILNAILFVIIGLAEIKRFADKVVLAVFGSDRVNRCLQTMLVSCQYADDQFNRIRFIDLPHSVVNLRSEL